MTACPDFLLPSPDRDVLSVRGCALRFFVRTYFSSTDDLAILLFLQILLAAIWNYRARFFPLLLVVFLWAGMVVPLNVAWTSGRWLVLAVGALAGLIVYVRRSANAHS